MKNIKLNYLKKNFFKDEKDIDNDTSISTSNSESDNEENNEEKNINRNSFFKRIYDIGLSESLLKKKQRICIDKFMTQTRDNLLP